MRLGGAAVALLAAAALLGGCGEKDEPGAGEVPASPPAPGPSTAASYREAADRLCSQAMSEQERSRRLRGGRQVTLRDRARLLVELAPARRELAERLAELPLPAEQRRAAERLLAAAKRRAVASAEAGRLHEAGGPRSRIAAAAAAEHDERELFVEIAGRLGLKDCAEVLSPADARLVRATVERGLASPDPAARCAVFGERFLKELYGGGRQACVEARARGYATGPVNELTAPEGMDGVFALARVAVGGSGANRQTYRVRLTHEDGAYKIDKLD